MTPSDDSPPASAKNGTSHQQKANASEPAPKRRRVALACSACRIRKSRCNGLRPRCDTCEKLGFECLYEQQETSANLLVPKDLFAALEAKVKLLETNLEHHSSRLNIVENKLSRPDTLQQDVQLPIQTQVTKPGSLVVNIDEIREGSVGQSMTDGMAVSFVDEQDCGFFVSQGISNEPHKSEANVLPPDEVMQRLIRAYFDNTGLLFPYIHEQDFLDTYQRFRASGFKGDVRRTWLGLLNMILAMATCTSCWEDSGSEAHFEESDVYYRRAQDLCQTQMFRGTTLETVQYLLLTSQYLQGTHKSVHTWTIHGLAVKAAMSIGLHSRDIASKFTPLQQEMRKRTWFGCVLLDRLLYRILGRIIGSLYGNNLGCEDQASDTVTMTSIIQFGQELSDWQHSLPQNMTLRSVDDIPENTDGDAHCSPGERFRIILTLRYLNVQLLLHRPIFIRSLGALLKDPKKPRRSTASINSMQANFDRVFIQVAENTIDIIHTILKRPDHGRHLIGAWWYTLYFGSAFSAALAIFGSLLISLDAEVGNAERIENAKQYLGKTSEALLKLSGHNTLVLRCVKFIHQLLRIVNAWDPSASETANPRSETLESGMAGEGVAVNFDLESDLLSTMPTWETSTLDFSDELELGHFFASDSQRWFERTQW
ncbi:hypothetical protein FBEOM_10950 [Fusarium beomiforme]|uniref:Zn(2)-C6 fungal-type domain-containing protein n=1 Tax=Fusarium beomiforme TaxID=44412 RepID=A0A9P5AAX8_9HYPO|nr:hypothetical protein FBEOM_10950 [Fusarium beomiforme]